ncbi:uncharacterized protein [Ptychodera flava]|uniref:uncharacterized protein n=1 Tax=Ptychodera flava TaxID=63121 RepID=UPI00396A42F3
MTIKIICTLLLVALGKISECYSFVINNSAESDLTEDEIVSLRDFITTTMACKNVTGLTIAMVRDGKTVFADGFGYLRVGDDTPVTNKTLFNIGSVSKTFTATIAADAIGRKLSNWDTPLRSILGEDFWLPGQFRTEEISLRDVLAHKAGIPSYWGVSTAALNLTRKEIVRRIRHFHDARKFRSGWMYSNYMYVLAGYVTEVLTDNTWEEAVKTVIFDKLGMTSSRVSAEMTDSDWANTCWSRIDSEGINWIEVDEPGQISFINEMAPAGGIFSNAVDMAEYMKFHLRYGKNEAGEQVVDESALRNTYTPAFTMSSTCCLYKPYYPVDDTRTMYGLGWHKGSYRGFAKNYHTGSYSGYVCRFTLFHSKNSGAFVCVNSPGENKDYDTVYATSLYAYDLVLGLEPWLNSSTGCTYPNPWRSPPRTHSPHSPMTTPSNPPLRPLTDYVGEFGHFAFGNFSITFDAEAQVLRYEFGKHLWGTLSPHPTSSTTLFMRIEGPISYREYYRSDSYPHGWPVDFTEDENNNIVTVKVLYLEDDYPPVFTKGLKFADAPETPPGKEDCSISKAPATVVLMPEQSFTFVLLSIFEMMLNLYVK